MLTLTLILSALMATNAPTTVQTAANIYEFKVDALEGGTIDFRSFAGKKILIVNTASKCGYTKQYTQLEELYREMGDKLVVIGFPANNFGKQEPGTNEEIAAFCEKNYGVTFPMAAKVSVKGGDMHPIFQWLTSAPNPDFDGDINWNFEKFLIDENGKLIHRYRSGVDPMSEKILSDI